MSEEVKLIKKTNNCVDEYADSFGYSSFGSDESGYFSSLSFFKYVTEWSADESDTTHSIKYNLATIRIPEQLALQLADFIYQQHDARKKESAE